MSKVELSGDESISVESCRLYGSGSPEIRIAFTPKNGRPVWARMSIKQAGALLHGIKSEMGKW